jgi:hypothetical protein
LPLIGRALNHTNISTTQVYARLDLEPVRDALERNAKLMLGKAGNESDQDAGAVRRGLPEAQPGWSK